MLDIMLVMLAETALKPPKPRSFVWKNDTKVCKKRGPRKRPEKKRIFPIKNIIEELHYIIWTCPWPFTYPEPTTGAVYCTKMLDLCSRTIEKVYYARELLSMKWVYYSPKLCGNIARLSRVWTVTLPPDFYLSDVRPILIGAKKTQKKKNKKSSFFSAARLVREKKKSTSSFF